MKVYQYDAAGVFLWEAEADPSPLEPGVYLIPARCTTTPPPADIPEGHVARWNGAAWSAVRAPSAPRPQDPVAKLQQFLAANPDVAAIINDT